MSPMIEIREASPAEHAEAGDVAVAGYAEFYGEMLGSYADHLRDVAGRAATDLVLVAVDGGRIVGTVTYVPDASSPSARQHGDEASIRMLSIAPEAKRRGIGRALSLACIDRARRDGKRAIMLHADEIMKPARALYESLGFRRDPGRDFAPDDQTWLVAYVLDL